MARLKLYGCTWPEGWQRHNVEFYCWANYSGLQVKVLERWEHLKNGIMLVDEEMRKGWNPWTDLMCWAYGNYSYVAALGCTASTKTHTFHKLAMYDYLSSPKKTAITCSTTNASGLDQRMWPIIRSTYAYLKKTGMVNDWQMTVSPQKIVKCQPGETKYVIRAQTIDLKADEQAVVDQLIGVHTERRTWIVDEATSAPPAVLKAWPNALASTEHKRLIMLGNPHDYADQLAMFCTPIGGWSTIDENTEKWEFEAFGEKGIGLHFHGKNSPNITKGKLANGKERWPFLYDNETYRIHESNKEKDPVSYWRFCVGWFQPEGVSRRVCSMAAIEKHKCKEHVIFRGGDTKFFGSLDPAFGGDRCMFNVWKMGTCAETGKVKMDRQERLQIPINPKGMPGEQIGKFIQPLISKWNLQAIGIDTTTGNSSCAEWLSSNTAVKILWIPFGGAASDDRTVSPSDDRTCRDAYYNRAAELAFSVSNNIELVHGLDVDTCIELCSRYWEPVGEKPTRQRLETKDEYRARMRKSCDDADVTAIGFEVFRRLGGLDLKKNNNRAKNWSAIARRKARIWNSETSYSE